jgi:hypothetical protein
MAERKRFIQIETSANPWQRVHEFLDAFHTAPDSADLEIRIGRDEHGRHCVMVTIDGRHFPMLTSEARRVAHIMENAMRKYPDDPESRTLPNIIIGLRAGCNKAEQESVDNG